MGREYPARRVIYYTARNTDDNIGDPGAGGHLVQRLLAASALSPGIPPQILASTRRGEAPPVARFRCAGRTEMPGSMAHGAGCPAADARRSAKIIGAETAAVG